MFNTKTSCCPKCKYEIVIQNFFSNQIIIPKYCDKCGTILYDTCPECGEKFNNILKFCPICHKVFYEEFAVEIKKNLPVISPLYVDKLDQIEKYPLYYEAIFFSLVDLVAWDNMPLSSILQFNNTLEEVNFEKKSLEENLRLTKNALSVLDFDTSFSTLEANDQIVLNFIEGLLEQIKFILEKSNFSIAEDFPEFKTIDIFKEEWIERAKRITTLSLNVQEEFKNKLEQINLYYPEYENLLKNKSGLDALSDIGSMFGTVGAIGSMIFDSYRDTKAQDTIETFFNSCSELIELGKNFGNNRAAEFEYLTSEFMKQQKIFYNYIRKKAQDSISYGYSIDNLLITIKHANTINNYDNKKFILYVLNNSNHNDIFKSKIINHLGLK